MLQFRVKTESDETKSFSFLTLNCIKIPWDGHCLVHAVLTSVDYTGLNRVPTKDTQLNLAYYEVINHLEYFGSFVNYEDSDLVQELEDYLYKI